MTVVPRQSTTTAAPRAAVSASAPIAVMRPSSTSSASASSDGASSTPVAIAPMLTRPSVVTGSVLAEASVHHRLRGLPVVRAVHPPVHDRLGRRVEHLVLELTATELGTDEVPQELQQLDPLAGGGGARLE